MGVDLKRITKGRLALASRTAIYSGEGVGKTMFACGAPDPFIVDADQGSHKFDVSRIVPNDWEDVRECVAAVESGEIKCKSLVIDSVTQVEFMLHRFLFKEQTVSEYKGGYAKGDDAAVMVWRDFLSQLERIWLKGTNIILVAHATVKRFEDPLGPGYDRFEIAARPQLARLIRQWSDYVLFARTETAIQKVGDDKTKAGRAVTTGIRWAHAKRSAAYDAKARGTNEFPDRFLLSWSEFESSIRSDDARASGAADDIEKWLVEINEPSFTKLVRDFLRDNPKMLPEMHNRVASKVEEKRAAPATVVTEKTTTTATA